MPRIDSAQAPTGDGWLLMLRRTTEPGAVLRSRPPILILPGYGMNSFIFSYHPSGVSLEASLARQGFEVWAADLRGQGRSHRLRGARSVRLEGLALVDVPACVRCVLEHTETNASEVDVIGCSLGATLVFAHLVCAPHPQVRRIVSIGGPLRWVHTSPVLQLLSSSPLVAGLVPIHGARALASMALPVLRKVPRLLSFYLHPQVVDMSHTAQLARTVENPGRHLNRDLARWVRERDLVLEGRNICEEIRNVTNDLLTVVANGDGLVPRETALWPHENIGSSRRDILEVGSERQPLAHADLFVSNEAPRLVFEPLGHWLGQESASPSCV